MMKKLLFAAVLIGIAAVVTGQAKKDAESWKGMSDDEARDRLEQRLPGKIPDDKREEIKDAVVKKMHERGVLVDDVDAAPADELVDLTVDTETAGQTTDA
jgi:hypothetical protein